MCSSSLLLPIHLPTCQSRPLSLSISLCAPLFFFSCSSLSSGVYILTFFSYPTIAERKSFTSNFVLLASFSSKSLKLLFSLIYSKRYFATAVFSREQSTLSLSLLFFHHFVCASLLRLLFLRKRELSLSFSMPGSSIFLSFFLFLLLSLLFL